MSSQRISPPAAQIGHLFFKTITKARSRPTWSTVSFRTIPISESLHKIETPSNRFID